MIVIGTKNVKTMGGRSGQSISKGNSSVSNKISDSFEDIIPVSGKNEQGVIVTGYNQDKGITKIERVLKELGISERFQNAELRDSSYINTVINDIEVYIRIANHTKRLGRGDDASYVSYRKNNMFEADIVNSDGVKILARRLREVFG